MKALAPVERESGRARSSTQLEEGISGVGTVIQRNRRAAQAGNSTAASTRLAGVVERAVFSVTSVKSFVTSVVK
jgi:hypothetical protein